MSMEMGRMNGWQKIRLGEVIESANTGLDAIKRAPIVKFDTGIKCLRIQDISQAKDFKNWGYCEVEERNYDKFSIKKGDIFIARTGATIGVNVLFDEDLKSVFNNGLIRLRVNEVIADYQYIYYIMQSRNYKAYIKSISGGTSTQPNMKINALLDYEISLPSLEEQREIGLTLKVLDDKIENNRKINQNLEEIAQAIFKSWFVDFEPWGGKMPDGWKKSSLTEIANYLNGLAMQKFRPHGDEVGIPVLKIKELRQGFTDSSSDLCSPNIKEDYIVNDGDVIFSWSGSLLIDFWCSGIAGLNQHLFKVTSDRHNKWFYYSWTKYHLEEFIAIAADRATTMGHIKREHLKNAEVLIPNDLDYEELGSVLDPIFDKIINNRVEIQNLVNLRDDLLPRLVSHELEVEGAFK